MAWCTRASSCRSERRAETLRDDGRDVKARLDTLTERAGQLRQLSAPSALARRDQQLVGHIDRVIDAVDTWSAWNSGRGVNVHRLLDALDTLDHASRGTDANARTRVRQLTEPLADWLTDRGHLAPAPAVERQPDHDTGLGIEL